MQMKPAKNSSSLFQENSFRLTVQPSSEAWSKVRRRLDGQMRQTRVLLVWWGAALAAILVLICGIYFTEGFSKNKDAVLDVGPPPKNLQNLELTTDCNVYCQQLELRKQLPPEYKVPSR